MTKAEILAYFAMIAAAYPRDQAFIRADEAQVNLWHSMLADVPAHTAEACLRAHIATSPFPPGISDIRGWMAKSCTPAMSGAEAWGKVLDTVRKHGYYEPRQAQKELDGPIWDAFRLVFGNWQQFCMSENPVADRAHFLRVWEAMEKQQAQKVALPSGVRAALGDCKLLQEGTEA